MKRTCTFGCLVALVIAGLFVGCTTAPKSEEDKQTLATNSTAALKNFNTKDDTLQPMLDKSVGYVIFPDIGKAGFIVGGSYGRGEVYERGMRIGYADMTAASAGLQAGAQNFTELLVFMKQDEFDKFKMGNDFSLGANVSAVALSKGAAGATDQGKAVIAIVDAKGGLMAEAAVGGQRIRYMPVK